MPTLPNPGMSFTPFDPLPAADLNDMVENIEAIADLSVFAAGDIPRNLVADLGAGLYDFVESGLVWTPDAAGSTLLASMTAGVVYINGKKVSVNAVSNRAFTASRDTYVDVGDDGVVDYNAVTNGSASPALAANHVRIAIVVSGASNIAAATSINQGQWNRSVPSISSQVREKTDSLGNIIFPTQAASNVIGGFTAGAMGGVTSATPQNVTNALCNFIVPSRNRNITIIVDIDASADASQLGEFHIKIDGTSVKSHRLPMNGTGGWTQQIGIMFNTNLTAGAHNANVAIARATGSGNLAANNVTMTILLS